MSEDAYPPMPRRTLPKPKRVWGNMTTDDIAKRNGAIVEKYALGWSRQALAEHFDLTTSRIDQIIKDVR